MKKAIRDLHSNKSVPPRFCDVVLDDDGQAFLVYKKGKEYVKIAWSDVEYQVNAMLQAATSEEQ